MQYNELVQCSPYSQHQHQPGFSIYFGQPGTYNVNLQFNCQLSTNQSMAFHNLPYGPPLTYMQPNQQLDQQNLYSTPINRDPNPRIYSYRPHQYRRPQQSDMQDHTYASIDGNDSSVFCNPPSGHYATHTPGPELSKSWKYMGANTPIVDSQSIYAYPDMTTTTNANNGQRHCNGNNGYMGRQNEFNHTTFPNSNMGATASTPGSPNNSCFSKKCNVM